MKFKPVRPQRNPGKRDLHQIVMHFGTEDRGLEEQIRKAARHNDMAVSTFCRQAMKFALDNMVNK